jgi:hypothetical protein
MSAGLPGSCAQKTDAPEVRPYLASGLALSLLPRKARIASP